jgi:hypothetical protein
VLPEALAAAAGALAREILLSLVRRGDLCVDDTHVGLVGVRLLEGAGGRLHLEGGEPLARHPSALACLGIALTGVLEPRMCHSLTSTTNDNSKAKRYQVLEMLQVLDEARTSLIITNMAQFTLVRSW